MLVAGISGSTVMHSSRDDSRRLSPLNPINVSDYCTYNESSSATHQHRNIKLRSEQIDPDAQMENRTEQNMRGYARGRM